MDFEINSGVLTGYRGTGSNVVIPAGVRRIEENAFFQNGTIRSVTIPSGVKSIGDGAFYQCENLCSVSIPNTVETIEPNAFWGCNALKSIAIPGSVRTIQEHAFCNCENLREVTFSEGLVEIENDVFSGCKKLTGITLPSTIREIGSDAFVFCNNVDVIEIPSTIRNIGDDAFLYCGGLKRVIVFGGAKNEGKLRELREYFPDGVTMEWGKRTTSVTSSRTPAKRTTSTKKAGKKAGSSRYNDRVSFDLPASYEFVEGVDDDGDRTVKIGCNPSVDDDGETQYERTYIVVLKSLDDEDAGKDMLKILAENNKEAVVNQRLAGKPEAQLIISSTASSILGIEIRINMANLLVPVSESDGIMVSCIFPGGGEDENIYGPVIEQLKVIWSSMVIDGKKTTTGSVDTKSMTKDLLINSRSI